MKMYSFLMEKTPCFFREIQPEKYIHAPKKDTYPTYQKATGKGFGNSSVCCLILGFCYDKIYD